MILFNKMKSDVTKRLKALNNLAWGIALGIKGQGVRTLQRSKTISGQRPNHQLQMLPAYSPHAIDHQKMVVYVITGALPRHCHAALQRMQLAQLQYLGRCPRLRCVGPSGHRSS